MRNATKTVTVYSKKWDAEKGADVYQGTVIKDVSFFGRIATAVSTDGLTAACEAKMRIPKEVIPEGFAVKNGDLVCLGALTTKDVRPGDLDALCDYVYTVVGVTDNLSGRSPHIKVVCK